MSWSRGTNLSEKAEDQIGELLAGPMKTLGLGVLKNLAGKVRNALHCFAILFFFQ